MLAFRIFVMLSCLIVVPMAAIFGSAFPDVVKSVLVDRIVAWSTGKQPDAAGANSENGFGDVTSTNAPPGANGSWEAPRWGAPANNPTAWQGQPPNPHSGGVVPAGGTGFNALAGNQASFATTADPGRGMPAAYPPQRATTEAPRYNAPPQQFSYPATSASLSPGETRGPAGQQPTVAEQQDRFTVLERKLREYGATYYLLETWGNEGELYRFHCKMASGGNPNYTRHFEATDRDALKAMSQAVEKVEAWRTGRLQ